MGVKHMVDPESDGHSSIVRAERAKGACHWQTAAAGVQRGSQEGRRSNNNIGSNRSLFFTLAKEALRKLGGNFLPF